MASGKRSFSPFLLLSFHRSNILLFVLLPKLNRLFHCLFYNFLRIFCLDWRSLNFNNALLMCVIYSIEIFELNNLDFRFLLCSGAIERKICNPRITMRWWRLFSCVEASLREFQFWKGVKIWVKRVFFFLIFFLIQRSCEFYEEIMQLIIVYILDHT